MIETVMTAQMPVGLPIKIKKNRLEPDTIQENMPRLSIVAGVHGDELQGQYICYELIRRIKEERENLKGIVDVYPCVAPMALEIRKRNAPGALDMNAMFPGSHHGHTIEYMAAEVIEDLKGSDFCIDIHSSDIFIRELPQIRVPENAGKKVTELAQKSGIPVLWMNSNSSSVWEGSLAYSLRRKGIPNLVIESGIALKIDYEYCKKVIDGIFRMMKELEVFEGEVSPTKKTVPVKKNDVEVIHCNTSGIFIPKIQIGSFVRENQVLGCIVRPILGAELEEVKSSCDGMIFSLREYPAVCEGELLARICKAERPAGKYE
nr:M14 family metallopeptidase [uncultured Anaerobutyricum sp.]